MKIFFDLGGTIFGVMDNSLRPGVKDLIQHLREDGHEVYFWTGGNLGEYRGLLRLNNIEGELFSKNDKLPFTPDIVVDDSPSVCCWCAGKTVEVEPYISSYDFANPIKLDVGGIGENIH